jgi:hypothetical protein
MNVTPLAHFLKHGWATQINEFTFLRYECEAQSLARGEKRNKRA